MVWDGRNHFNQACVGYIWVWCGLACCSSTIRTFLCFKFVLPAEDYRLAGAAVGLTHHKWWVIASPQHHSQRLFQRNEGWKNIQLCPLMVEASFLRLALVGDDGSSEEMHVLNFLKAPSRVGP